jgi:hypothetical protein
MRRILLFFALVSSAFGLLGQTTLNTTVGSTLYTGTNTNGSNSFITFAVANNSATPIYLTDVGNWTSSVDNGVTYTLWYSASSLSGTPGTIGPTTWSTVATNTISGIASSTLAVNPVFSGLTFLIPAGTTYRFALHTTGANRYSGSSTAPFPSPSTLTSNGVSLLVGDAQIAGANVGWAATNTPRHFTGSITFVPAGPCTNPPVAGTALASASLVCANAAVNLSLTGTSFGTGQSYQWQSSPDNTNWTNVTGATTATATVNPSANTYYRCGVTCGATTYSASVLVTTAGGPLSGTYTINKNQPASATNFQSFTSLATALVCGSLSGNVVVNVAPNSGPYNEQFTLGTLNGASATNTLTINGNGNFLDYTATGVNDRTTILLDGTDYLTVDSLKIIASGATYGWAVQLTNQADHNTFRRCRIESSVTGTSSNHCGVVVNGSLTSATTAGTAGNHNLFERNNIVGGYYGIITSGTTTARNVRNTFRKNKVHDFYFYGIYNGGQDSLKIQDNDISRPNRTNLTTGYGVYFTNVGKSSVASGNWIHGMFAQGSSTTSTFYGLYQTASDNAAGDEGLIYNNIISDNQNDGAHYVIYNLGSDGWNYYHNTIIEDHANNTAGLTRGFYQTTAADRIVLRNNLIHINRVGNGVHHAIYLNTATSVVTLNTNAYYMPGTGVSPTVHFGYAGGANRTTFADWQTFTGQDGASVEGNPLFDMATNGVPTAAYFNNIGANLQTVVPTDFGGNARGAAPDPGAWEFTPPPGPDITVLSLSTASGAVCGGTTSAILSLQNIGTDSIFTLQINWQVNSVAQTPIVVTDTFITGTIKDYILSPITVTGSAISVVTVNVNNVGPTADTDPANNLGTLNTRGGYSGNLFVNQGITQNDSTFNTFTNLANALMTNGICGPVNVQVVAGQPNFVEQFMLGEIPGASAVNTISIEGNGNTIQYTSTNSAERGVIMFNGTDYVSINNLNIFASASGSSTSEYGFGIHMYNGANYNAITNSTITATKTSTSTNFAGIAVSGSTTSATGTGLPAGSYNRFTGNTIVGGYYGLTLATASTDKGMGNYVAGNTIQDAYLYGVYAVQQDSINILSNDISRATRTTLSTFYGIYVSGESAKSRISKNRMHNNCDGDLTSTSTAYPLYITGWSGLASNSNIVSNNMIYAINNGGTTYAIYLSSSNNLKIYHNTVALIDPNPSASTTALTRGVFYTGTFSNVEFKNNLIAVDRNSGGLSYVMYVTSSGSGYTFENNAYFRGGFTSNFGYYGNGMSNFGLWQAATGQDAASVQTRPFFVDVAANDFTPRAAALDNLGANLSADVSTDITGATRGTTPDPGAIEFTAAPCTGISGLTQTALTASSAAYQWNMLGSAVQVEWGPAGFTQGSGTGNIVNIPSTSATLSLSGLSPNTCYDVYFQQTCSSSIPGAPPVLGPITFCTPCLGQLAGVYTVGGPVGPNNFATLDSALSTLGSCGISGPVVMNLAAGASFGKGTLGSVSGSSAINTITFNGVAANRPTVEGLTLDGTDYVNVSEIDFIGASGFTVLLTNEANHISFNNCKVQTSITSTSTLDAAFVATGSLTSASTAGNNANYLSVTNCEIIGGYYGLSIYGTGTTVHGKGVNFSNNTFRDQYYYGLRVYYMDSVDVIANDFSQGFRNATSYANYIYNDNFVNFERNVAYNTSYGVYAYGTALNNPAGTSRYVNNMLFGSTYGLYFSTMKNTQVYHNSCLGGRGFYSIGTSDNLDMRNNIFGASSTTGYSFYASPVPTNSVINYNAYDTTVAPNVAYWDASAYASLAAWRTAVPTQNANSIQGAIGVNSLTDFHIVGTLPNDRGDNSVGVLVDIDGDVRPAVGALAVDMGADEYTPLNFDVTAVAIPSPNSNACGDSNTTVAVVIGNLGLQTLTNISVSLNVSGASTGTFNTTYTGSLSSLQTDTVFLGPLNTAIGGTFNLQATATVTGDQNAANNTVSKSFNHFDILARQPSASQTTFCAGQYDTLYFPSNIANLNLEWRNSAGAVLGTTDSLVVGPLGSNDTTFYLAAVASVYRNLGALNNSIGAAANFTDPSVQQLYFTALQPFTLDSVTVYPNGNGNVNINLVNFTTNAIIQTITVPVTGVTTPGTAKRIAVGMSIAPGTYKLHGGGSTTGGLWRNSAGASYPYSVPGIVDITGNSFDPAYYYYFYRWTITAGGCPRPDGEITLINNGIAPVPSFTAVPQAATLSGQTVDFDASATVGATTYDWDFGDGNTGTGAVTSHTYTTNGSFTVVLTVTSSCGTTTTTQTVITAGIGVAENALGRSLLVYPNPATDVVKVSFESFDGANATVRVVELSGKEVFKVEANNINGSFNQELNLAKLAKGVYLLEVYSGELKATRKLIKH